MWGAGPSGEGSHGSTEHRRSRLAIHLSTQVLILQKCVGVKNCFRVEILRGTRRGVFVSLAALPTQRKTSGGFRAHLSS